VCVCVCVCVCEREREREREREQAYRETKIPTATFSFFVVCKYYFGYSCTSEKKDETFFDITTVKET